MARSECADVSGHKLTYYLRLARFSSLMAVHFLVMTVREFLLSTLDSEIIICLMKCVNCFEYGLRGNFIGQVAVGVMK